MSDPGVEVPVSPVPPAPAVSRPSRRRDAGAVTDVCPLLVSADAAWRSAYASRDHRCWAVRPAAPLVLAKQRELCLTAAHGTCATYVAARGGQDGDAEDADADPVDADRADSLLWPRVRSIPLALEPSRGRTAALPATPGRAGGQALLVGLMVLAFLVLVIARTTAPSGAPSTSAGPTAAIGASPSSIPEPSPAPSAVPTATRGPSPAATAAPAPTPTAAPSRTPAPSVARTYKVQSGDTLGEIAAKFGTTVKLIAAANGITDPSLIRVGQVLIIP